MKGQSLLLTLLIFPGFLFAQIDPTKIKPLPDAMVNKSIRESSKNWVEIFTLENYKGSSKVFGANSDAPNLPDKLSKISIRLKPNTVAYLKINCTDIPYEVMISSNTTSFKIPDLGTICGIRIDERAAIIIKFNGVDAEIHNNDCRKLWGKISVSVIEKQPDASFVQCYNLSNNLTTVFLDTKKTGTPIFSYFFNKLADPPTAVVRDYVTRKNIEDSFIVGKSAITERRIFVKVKSQLNTEHKSSDLALDYTSSMFTSANDTEFNINRLPFFNTQSFGKSLVAGPFIAKGISDRAGYINTKNFRIFLSVVYDFRLTGE